MSIFNEEQIRSGELAGIALLTKIPKPERMDMVSKGYNPFDGDDVLRYYGNQKPNGGFTEVAGVNTHKSLGEGKYNESRDRQLIERQIKGGGLDFDKDDFGYTGGPVNSKEEFINTVKDQMAPSNTVSDLNNRLMERMGPSPSVKSNLNNSNASMVVDPNKAKLLGYTLGARYVNAFTENLKTSSSETRNRLITETNNIEKGKSKVHPSILHIYEEGIKQAENELYNKLKK